MKCRTLWFKRGIDDPNPWEITVNLPKKQTPKEEQDCLQRIANGVASLMFDLHVTDLVIQGQFKMEKES